MKRSKLFPMILLFIVVFMLIDPLLSVITELVDTDTNDFKRMKFFTDKKDLAEFIAENVDLSSEITIISGKYYVDGVKAYAVFVYKK